MNMPAPLPQERFHATAFYEGHRYPSGAAIVFYMDRIHSEKDLMRRLARNIKKLGIPVPPGAIGRWYWWTPQDKIRYGFMFDPERN